jgi:hypothetical protein
VARDFENSPHVSRVFISSALLKVGDLPDNDVFRWRIMNLAVRINSQPPVHPRPTEEAVPLGRVKIGL